MIDPKQPGVHEHLTQRVLIHQHLTLYCASMALLPRIINVIIITSHSSFGKVLVMFKGRKGRGGKISFQLVQRRTVSRKAIDYEQMFQSSLFCLDEEEEHHQYMGGEGGEEEEKEESRLINLKR
jgi:hypothetical protein